MPRDGRGGPEGGVRLYGGLTLLLALTMIGLGIAIAVVTIVHGGGSVGVALGTLFVAAGAGRLYADEGVADGPQAAEPATASSTPGRSSRSPMARSRRRSTSRSA